MRIANLYEHLTSEERFRAFVAAIGRRDDTELDHLENSCPTHTYRGPDAEYTRLKINHMMSAIFMTANLFATAEAGWLSAHLLTLAKGSDEDMLEQQLTLHVRRYLTIRAGWRRFCEEQGIAPDAYTPHFCQRDPAFGCLADQLAEKFPERFTPDPDEIAAHTEGYRRLLSSGVL